MEFNNIIDNTVESDNTVTAKPDIEQNLKDFEQSSEATSTATITSILGCKDEVERNSLDPENEIDGSAERESEEDYKSESTTEVIDQNDLDVGFHNFPDSHEDGFLLVLDDHQGKGEHLDPNLPRYFIYLIHFAILLQISLKLPPGPLETASPQERSAPQALPQVCTLGVV